MGQMTVLDPILVFRLSAWREEFAGGRRVPGLEIEAVLGSREKLLIAAGA